MKRRILICAVFAIVSAFATSTFATLFTFDDFSSLTTDPELSGVLLDAGFEATFSGDDTAILTDLDNGSWNSLILGYYGTSVRHDQTSQLTISFSLPVTELIMEFDAMHLGQEDAITASAGTWIDFPATLSLSGRTLSSTADYIIPGGSGIDDDLLTTLAFGSPIYSITFESVGNFTLDALKADAIVPEPATLSMLGLGGLLLLRGPNVSKYIGE